MTFIHEKENEILPIFRRRITFYLHSDIVVISRVTISTQNFIWVFLNVYNNYK